MIEDGNGVPTKEVTMPIKPNQFPNEMRKSKSLPNFNSKALGILINDLTQIEFYKVINITCAKNLWGYLEVTHEGTNQVKKSKINMLVTDFETFFMKSNEAIDEFFNMFKGITNEF